MSRSFSRLGALLVLASLLFAVPAHASAAPVKLDDTTIYVQFWPEGETSTNVVIVGVELDPKVPLPATVQLPLPPGATVFWSGEISGADPANDVQREFTVKDVADGKVVEFTVETTRAVQFDATIGAVDIDGDDIVTALDWTQSVPSAGVSFAVRVPAGVEAVRISPKAPGDPQTNSSGEKLYTLTDQVLKPGDTSRVEVRYRRLGIEGTSGSPGLLPILLGLLAVAVVILVAAIVIQNRRSAPAE